MARELNRELFAKPQAAENDEPHLQALTYAKAEDLRVMHLHIETMSKRMKEFESRVEQMNTKVEGVINGNKQRFERVQGHFQRQTEMIQNSMGDIHNKIAQVVSRVNERRVGENVVKEMVDRHNQLMQNYEVRLQQMQKVLSEQELQLMNARAELRDALQELSRLKKY